METYPPLEWTLRFFAGRIKGELAEIADDIPLGPALQGRHLLLGKIFAKVAGRWIPDSPRFDQLQTIPMELGQILDILQEYNDLLDPHNPTIALTSLDERLLRAANLLGGSVMTAAGFPKDPYVERR